MKYFQNPNRNVSKNTLLSGTQNTHIQNNLGASLIALKITLLNEKVNLKMLLLFRCGET